MNKYFMLTIASALTVTLSGCFSTYTVSIPEKPLSEITTTAIIEDAPPTAEKPYNPSKLWKEASPETSMLQFYVYNGKTVTSQYLSDLPKERELLSLIETSSGIPLESWSADDISAPIYGIDICKKDGSPLQAAWTNGFLILNDGTAYEFDLDTSKWAELYFHELPHEFADTAYLPCADYLLRAETGWNFDLMTETAPTEEIPENISLKTVSANDTAITVKYTHNGQNDNEWLYGTHYAIHTENDGKWYTIPTKSDMHYAFNDIGLILMPEQAQEETYSTDMYGNLPDGHYRLYANGLTVEFDVADNKIILP